MAALALVSLAVDALAQTANRPRLRAAPAASPATTAAANGLRGAVADDDVGAIPILGAPSPNDAPLPPTATPGAANYGRPRPPVDPRTRYTGQPQPQPLRALPALTPYPTAPVLRQRGQVAQDLVDRPPPPIAQAPPIPRKTPPKVEVDPYQPLGVGIGSLRLRPYVEGDTGYDSNPERAAGSNKGSMFERTEGGFALQSDWSRHSLTANGELGYNWYNRNPSANRPDGTFKADLRLDATRDTQINLEARAALTTQRASSPDFTTIGLTVSGQPAVYTFGETIGVTQAFGRFSLSLSSLVDRTTYEDATLANGQTFNLSRDNFNAYGFRTKAAYEITPGISPFIEATVDTRQRDNPVDNSGYRRDSRGGSIKAGSTFELSRILTGTLSAGYTQRHYDDPRLRDTTGPAFDSALVWTATPLTTVTLKAATDIQETTIPGASGAYTNTATLQVDHALRRNLVASAIGSVSDTKYQGVSLRETTYTGTLRADYSLTRSLVVRGSFTTQRLQSTSPGSDYTANTFLLGLKLQR